MRESAWRYVTERSGAGPRGVEQMAADTVDTGCEARTEEGTRRFDDLGHAGFVSQAVFFGVGGSIHAAVGLAGGIGGFSTNRSGFSRKAWSSVA